MQDVLRNTEDHDIGPAISHFFNCFFGSYQAVGVKATANSTQARTSKKVWYEKYGWTCSGFTIA